MKGKSLRGIWIMFVVFVVIFILNMSVVWDINATQRMWLVMDVWSLVLSIILLFRHRLPSAKQICISLILGGLVSLSYLQGSAYSIISSFLITVMAALAVFSTFAVYRESPVQFLRRNGKGGVTGSIIWGLLFGLALGAVNVGLMLSNNELNVQVSLSRFLVSLNPAVLEEIAMRTLFFAFCYSLLQGRISTKGQRFTCWFMMVIPHVLIHTPEAFMSKGVISGLVVVILTTVIFGLPFAYLQWKRDVTSAMIAHGVVDFIRFCLFGLPF
ncbi:hypothetical protein H70357_03715 [Paenibacillus sp. FSL H7-0357]|uniref:hypothetical protein n=1 Tax=Paenibacillus sp. FSL H7-0357 TaxID=1536774 RepID=UPI0004F7F2AE|nr:hypothetical protein [Paenibacillus sp. FSL H7-0357]AIQ15902.1 hypothetical protein H70357_03715 [Paenibacillus sp. FSL H7-0357]